jgi:hypothetical protein
MVSFPDMMALWLVIGVPIAIGMLVAKHFGSWAGIVAGFASPIVCVTVAGLAYRVRWRRLAQHCSEWKERYCGIYRIEAIPTDEKSIKKAKDAEIKIGDYGWEAVPLREDGLIYLHGLTPEWRVVWHAGFRPDQIEKEVVKPYSQYDWDHTRVRNPPPCPYPVQERSTNHMGLPVPH